MSSRPLLAELLAQTLTDPMAGAARIKAWALPREAAWLAFLLLAILSVLMAEAAAFLDPATTPFNTAIRDNPLVAGAAQLISMALTLAAIHGIGRFFGGKGTFDESLRLVTWFQAVLVALQLFQLAVLLVAPVFLGILGLFIVVYVFWSLSAFIAVLHGFENRGKVLIGILLALFAISFAAGAVLLAVGVDLQAFLPTEATDV